MSNRIGNLLLQAGIVTGDQLQQALGRQRRFGGRLATNCLAMGYANEHTLALMLSRQLGVPFVVLGRSAIPLSLLDSFPLDLARRLKVLPIHRSEREMFVAMADPANIAFLDEIRFTVGATIVEHGAVEGILLDVIEAAYRLKEVGKARFHEGSELDPAIDLKETGHIEIVVGSDSLGKDSLPPPEPIPGPSPDDGTGWVRELACREPPSSPARGGEPAILLVEDDSELRRMLKTFLQKSGFSVWEAADGTEAVRILQDQLPDAMVLDAMLPGVHGFDICSRIKQSESTRHVPVVMMSAVYRGWRYADDVRRMHGADAFLEKPLRLDELKHILERCLQEREVAVPTKDLCARAAQALQQAAAAYASDNLFEAAHFLEAAVEASPFSATLHHRLGILYDKLDEPYRAIASMGRAVELDPTYERLLSLARLYEKKGFTNKAFEAWERCLRACTSDQDAEAIRRHMDRLLA